MHPLVLPFAFIAAVFGGIIWFDLRYSLSRIDHLDTPGTRLAAYVWLGLFLFLVVDLVVGSAMHTPTARELATTPFYRLFGMHAILIIFLAVWWFLTKRPPLLEFLNIQRRN